MSRMNPKKNVLEGLTQHHWNENFNNNIGKFTVWKGITPIPTSFPYTPVKYLGE